MKSTEIDFKYPILGFCKDGDVWGFPDLNTLTSCGPRTLKKGMEDGLELVDAKQRRWVVRSIQRTGRGEPLWLWILSAMLSTRQSRIEQELEAMPPIPFDKLKERVVVWVEANSENFCLSDEIETELKPLIAKVRAAKTNKRIFDLLGLDSFMAY